MYCTGIWWPSFWHIFLLVWEKYSLRANLSLCISGSFQSCFWKFLRTSAFLNFPWNSITLYIKFQWPQKMIIHIIWSAWICFFTQPKLMVSGWRQALQICLLSLIPHSFYEFRQLITLLQIVNFSTLPMLNSDKVQGFLDHFPKIL